MLSTWSQLLAEDNWSNQYTDTGWFAIAFTVLVVAFILGNIYRAARKGKGGKELYVRRIPGLNAIDEAVGRATEMGRPVVMVPGLGDLNANSMQALNIFAHITRTAAKFANPILLCCAVPSVYTVAQEIISDVYQSEGLADRYDPESVRFLSDRQFAFAAGVSGLLLREKAAAAFFMGEFFAESLIFAETANSIGAIQVASSTQITQTPFFIAACDYVLIGEEFYAASAYLTRQPALVGSLVGQDWSKLTIAALIAFGAILNTAQLGVLHASTMDHERKSSEVVPLAKPRVVTVKDTFMHALFTPEDDPKLKDSIHRDKYDPSDLPQPDKAGAGS